MKTVPLKLKHNSYKIVVGDNILKDMGRHLVPLKLGRDALIITNPVIDKLHGQKLKLSLKKAGFNIKVFLVPEGEQSKSAKMSYQLMEQIAQYDVLKQPFIVAFGGGVIGDLAGYVAATYKRGIPYVQVPTTFLAQIDSAIGGKVAIDLSVGKNYVGAFYQPKIVYSDVATLKTIGQRQIRNGLAEAVKYGVIYDGKLFEYLENNYSRISVFDIKVLSEAVAWCSRIKADVVMADEKETKGIRTILNFGHTVGHAIEAAGKFRLYHHGEAIALGMRVAANISNQLKMFKMEDEARLNCLLSAVGLPEKIKKLQLPDILSMMNRDKKFISGKNRFVLAVRIGSVKVVEGIPSMIISSAIKKFM